MPVAFPWRQLQRLAVAPEPGAPAEKLACWTRAESGFGRHEAVWVP